YQSAPYGAETTTADSLYADFQSQYLECMASSELAAELFNDILRSSNSSWKLYMLGIINHPLISNHNQLLATSPEGNLVLDTTAGVVAFVNLGPSKGTFETAFGPVDLGQLPLPSQNVAVIGFRTVRDVSQIRGLRIFRSNVLQTLYQGAYTFSNVVYELDTD